MGLLMLGKKILDQQFSKFDLYFSYFAQRTLRIERMYAFWGQDIDKKTTPFDLNREFRVSFDVRNQI